jgi:hypothetical protein
MADVARSAYTCVRSAPVKSEASHRHGRRRRDSALRGCFTECENILHTLCVEPLPHHARAPVHPLPPSRKTGLCGHSLWTVYPCVDRLLCVDRLPIHSLHCSECIHCNHPPHTLCTLCPHHARLRGLGGVPFTASPQEGYTRPPSQSRCTPAPTAPVPSKPVFPAIFPIASLQSSQSRHTRPKPPPRPGPQNRQGLYAPRRRPQSPATAVSRRRSAAFSSSAPRRLPRRLPLPRRGASGGGVGRERRLVLPDVLHSLPGPHHVHLALHHHHLRGRCVSGHVTVT